MSSTTRMPRSWRRWTYLMVGFTLVGVFGSLGAGGSDQPSTQEEWAPFQFLTDPTSAVLSAWRSFSIWSSPPPVWVMPSG